MYGYNNPYLQNYQLNQGQTNFNQGFNQAQQPQDERIWVANETSAESYLLAPSGFARLWDSNLPRFYEKRADATGRPLPMNIYEYKQITPQNSLLNEGANNLPYDEINAKIEAINERIDKLENIKKGAGKNGKQSNADDTSI